MVGALCKGRLCTTQVPFVHGNAHTTHIRFTHGKTALILHSLYNHRLLHGPPPGPWARVICTLWPPHHAPWACWGLCVYHQQTNGSPLYKHCVLPAASKPIKLLVFFSVYFSPLYEYGRHQLPTRTEEIGRGEYTGQWEKERKTSEREREREREAHMGVYSLETQFDKSTCRIGTLLLIWNILGH